ncbi:helix-turn-helix domain-containing protein [uncultured Kocuria sp.]|uniref:helix-turn-helix domain-containing protein n=1 Tax=uncultured Kocuria sp. TaxID=259305 RepID=UPI000F89AFCC|nr:helix-turn-helix domain-containing protein [uncultured Kocuria sp.]RUQ19709.1 DNA-binding protein [Kocuria sp. HSID16901]
MNDVLGLVPLDRRTIYRGIEDGTIPGIKIGRRVMILRIPFLRMLTGEIVETAA